MRDVPAPQSSTDVRAPVAALSTAVSHRRPIYYFDIVEEFPEIGGVVDVSKALRRALSRRFGARLQSARDVAARLGCLDGASPYFDRERIAAEGIAEHDPRSVFIFPNFQSPIARRSGGPAIVNLIHDVQFAALPELFSAADRAWLDEAFAAARANADQLVFVSGATRDDYVARFGLPRAEAVIHPPVVAGAVFPRERENFLLACAHYDNHPHKNFAGLVTLFKALAPRVEGLRLVVTGHGRDGFMGELAGLSTQMRDRIDHRGFVPRAELDRLQARARALVSLSHFEGFNLPAAEASLRGTPLILSDLPAHRELYGDRACLVDACDPALDAVIEFLAGPVTVEPSALAHACRPQVVADSFAAIIARLDRAVPATVQRKTPALRRSAWLGRLLLSGTILSGVVTAAAAQQAYTPSGGAGGLSTNGFGGGAGGVGIGGIGMDGSPATTTNGSGGGGGGGGTFYGGDGTGGVGGNGMSGGALVPGGFSGGSAGADGMPGGSSTGMGPGGGGGGGAAGGAIALQGTTIANTTNQTGGKGGAGGAGGTSSILQPGPSSAGGNGGGGAGGLGIYITGGSAAGSNSASVIGGNGGAGGSNAAFGNLTSGGGGGGGDGGAGVYSLSTGTFTNSNLGSITGGTGGKGGDATYQSSGGNGGNGAPGFVLSGPDGTLKNMGGSIVGGQAGDRGVGSQSSYYGTRGTPGDGVLFTTSGTLINTGTIQGARGLTSAPDFNAPAPNKSGDGGRGVVIYSGATIDNTGGSILGGNAGMALETASGVGGVGLVGSDITLTNTRGTVAGGFDYSGTNQSTAIVLTGGFNQIGTGGEISGGINVTGTSIFQPAVGTSTPGTPLVISGPLNFDPTSTYQVRITPTASDSVQVAASRIEGVSQLNGTATLNGAAVKVVAGTGNYQAKTYTILTAENGVAGTFSSVSTNLAFLNPSLSYDANDVFLTIAPANAVVANNGTTLVPDYRYVALTLNQIAVATGLTNAAKRNNDTGPILTAFNQLTPQQARAAFDAISGEGITGAQNLAIRAGELFTSTIFDQTTFYGAGNAANSVTLTEPPPGMVALATGQGQAVRELADLPASHIEPVFAAPERTWRAWATGYGGVEDIHGNALPIGSAAQNNTLLGGALGVDYQLTPNYLLGVAVGGSDGSFQVPGRGTSGSSTGGQVAFYDIYKLGAWYGASSTAFEYYTNRSTRFVTGFGGLASETERANFASHEFRSRIEFGRTFDAYNAVLTPFAALEIADLRSNGFNETSISGPGLFRLNVSGQNTASVPAFAGLRAQRVTPLGNDMVLSPTLQLAYVHEFAPYRQQLGSLPSLPGATFLVDGARPSRDAAQVKAGAQLAISTHAAFFANFEGEFSGVDQFYAGKGGFKYVW